MRSFPQAENLLQILSRPAPSPSSLEGLMPLVGNSGELSIQLQEIVNGENHIRLQGAVKRN